jgi:HPt (histidine-containing phosphotransfer) domain-containing protein
LWSIFQKFGRITVFSSISVSRMASGGKLMSYSDDFSSSPRFDMQEALKSCMGSVSFVEELCQVFVLDSLPRFLPGLKQGVLDKNSDLITGNAHGIKGGCAVIGLMRARDMAYSIETASKEGDMSRVDKVMPQLEAELEDIVEIIKAGDISRL